MSVFKALGSGRVPWNNPDQVAAFDAFFAKMPDEQRDYAIEGLTAVGLPTSQEFLKAYTVGVAICMAAMLAGRNEDD